MLGTRHQQGVGEHKTQRPAVELRVGMFHLHKAGPGALHSHAWTPPWKHPCSTQNSKEKRPQHCPEVRHIQVQLGPQLGPENAPHWDRAVQRGSYTAVRRLAIPSLLRDTSRVSVFPSIPWEVEINYSM